MPQLESQMGGMFWRRWTCTPSSASSSLLETAAMLNAPTRLGLSHPGM
uniref:Alternative protein IL17RE n=1 Tax=Homo sapiens TaxID=9606 RepID=L8E985_HUMAN|nr:alternative protein IL17RE [Homo sapiens]